MATPPNPDKPVTSKKIPGTDVPDVSNADTQSDRDRKFMSRVAVSTAVFAAFAAVTSMFAGHSVSLAMVDQIEASDTWNWYQAKGVKHSVLEGRIEINRALNQPVPQADLDTLIKYDKEQEKLHADAQAFQASAAKHRALNLTLGRAATAFQIAIACAAVALLLRRNLFWIIAIVLGLIGAGVAAYGFLGA